MPWKTSVSSQLLITQTTKTLTEKSLNTPENLNGAQCLHLKDALHPAASKADSSSCHFTCSNPLPPSVLFFCSSQLQKPGSGCLSVQPLVKQPICYHSSNVIPHSPGPAMPFHWTLYLQKLQWNEKMTFVWASFTGEKRAAPVYSDAA